MGLFKAQVDLVAYPVQNRLLALRMQAVAELAAIEHELKRRQVLSSLKIFIQHAWSIVEPEHTLVWNWHLDVLCGVLQRMAAGRLNNVIIHVPPGTMKSLLVSVFYRAWLWARNPKFRFIAASYGAHLSLRDNARFRDIITSPWYQEWFPDTRIAGDQDAKQCFDTTQEGYSIATSVQGVGTGEHPDFVIIDDPHTALQPTSETPDALRSRALRAVGMHRAGRPGAQDVLTLGLREGRLLAGASVEGFLFLQHATGRGAFLTLFWTPRLATGAPVAARSARFRIVR